MTKPFYSLGVQYRPITMFEKEYAYLDKNLPKKVEEEAIKWMKETDKGLAFCPAVQKWIPADISVTSLDSYIREKYKHEIGAGK